MLVTTEAFVLKSRKYRESSKLIALYTHDFGRCNAIAKGARRAKNKFGSALDPLSFSSISLYHHPRRDLHTLTQAELAIPLRTIADSFERLTVGFSIAEAIYTSQLDEDCNPDLYSLLKQSMQALNNPAVDEQTLLFYFQIRLAGLLGFGLQPMQYADSDRKALATDAAGFTLSLTTAAPRQASLDGGTRNFSIAAESLEMLQRIVMLQPEKLPGIVSTQRQRQELREFLNRYFEFHLEKRLTARTDGFLRAVQQGLPNKQV